MLDNTGDQSGGVSPLIELGSLLANMPLEPYLCTNIGVRKGEQKRRASTHLHTVQVQDQLLAQQTVRISMCGQPRPRLTLDF